MRRTHGRCAEDSRMTCEEPTGRSVAVGSAEDAPRTRGGRAKDPRRTAEGLSRYGVPTWDLRWKAVLAKNAGVGEDGPRKAVRSSVVGPAKDSVGVGAAQCLVRTCGLQTNGSKRAAGAGAKEKRESKGPA